MTTDEYAVLIDAELLAAAQQAHVWIVAEMRLIQSAGADPFARSLLVSEGRLDDLKMMAAQLAAAISGAGNGVRPEPGG